LADELGQRGEVWCSGSIEAVAEIVPEADFELGACLQQAEEDIAVGAAGCQAGSAGDLAPRDLAADVVLGVVGVQGHIGTVQHHEDCTVAIAKRLISELAPLWLRIGGY